MQTDGSRPLVSERGLRDKWLRGIVPLLDLFMLLFAALLVLVTQQHREEAVQQMEKMDEHRFQHEQSLSAAVVGVNTVSIEIKDDDSLELDGASVSIDDLATLLRDRQASGARLVVVRDPVRALKHGTMKRIRAAATSADLPAAFTTDKD